MVPTIAHKPIEIIYAHIELLRVSANHVAIFSV